MTTVATLKIGEKGMIENLDFQDIPQKLLEMGCYPGKEEELVQVAPLNDPLYIRVSGSHLAIRRETAERIILQNQN